MSLEPSFLYHVRHEYPFKELVNKLTKEELELIILIYYMPKVQGFVYISATYYGLGVQLMNKGMISSITTGFNGPPGYSAYELQDYVKPALEHAPRRLVYKVCSKFNLTGSYMDNLKKEAAIETAKRKDLVPYLTDADSHIKDLAKKRFNKLNKDV